MGSSMFTGAGATTLTATKSTHKRMLTIKGFESALTATKKGKCVIAAIVQNFSYYDGDVLVPIVGVNDVRVLYSMGKNFGRFSVSGLIIFGQAGSSASNSFVKKLQTAFNSNRASTKKKPLAISGLGFQNTKVYPMNLQFSDADPNFNTVGFAIDCIVAPVKNKR